ncbi:hypothetical protein MLD38_019061 [Melastoma candidum]|nr:hypothetical protein MLD38_019061 [Melastoma candidum]
MYSKVGNLDVGIKMFDEMASRNIVSYTLVISAAIHEGDVDMGFYYFVDAMRHGLMPNEFTFCCVLKGCGKLGDHELGVSVQCLAIKAGLGSDPFFGSSMLSLYSKLGCIEEAERVFADAGHCDVGCFNAMMGGYIEFGYGAEAMKILSLTKAADVSLDECSFIGGFKGCGLNRNLDHGRELHGALLRTGMESSVPAVNALMDMYLKNGNKGCGLKVFRRMRRTDVVSWNTVFGAPFEAEETTELVDFFRKFMRTGMKPNQGSFSILARQCGRVVYPDLRFPLTGLIIRFGLLDDCNVASSLVHMFARCGEFCSARLVLDCTQSRGISCYNELISGYNLNLRFEEALRLFLELRRSTVEANECTFSSILESSSGSGYSELVKQIHASAVKFKVSSNGFVCSSLIKSYITFVCLDDSFRCLSLLTVLDLGCWSTLISTLSHRGFHSEAITSVCRLMEVGGKPNEFILGSVLNSCGEMASSRQSRSMHSLTIKTGYDQHECIASAAIDAYGKCGEVRSARKIFNLVSGSDDVIIFNSMIMAYAHHGLVNEAMEIFIEMKCQNLWPSQATFVSIISACSHMGFVDEGFAVFQSMRSDYGMKPSPGIFGSLVDMLSRKGYLENAKTLMETMPYEPWPEIWRCFLSGCRIHGYRELGEWASKKLCELVPGNDASNVLLFKVYTEAGYWEDAAQLQGVMARRGRGSKSPGYSWIQTE